MPIEMPRGLPFSVDTWTSSNRKKRHHFLTHAHKDHLAGFVPHASYPIYATRLTISLLHYMFPQVDESVFVEIVVGNQVVVRDPDGDFSFMALDANHCPGAVMFLFEGEFGNILHTGDCRLSSDCLQNFPLKYIYKNGSETLVHLDYIYLDCTFVRCSFIMPRKQSAIQQVINCIWKHPDAPTVYLACDLLGQEEILLKVSKTFGSKIYVDKSCNAECLQALSLISPEIISDDVSSRFQVFSYGKLYERASIKLTEARANIQPEPLFIRPSTQWYACDGYLAIKGQVKLNFDEAVRDEFGVWHVCYSMHSSRQELESALQFLQPKWVISTTRPCRAMELDYVKRHCYKTKINSDDPLWKLLKIDVDQPKYSVPSTSPKPSTITDTSVGALEGQTAFIKDNRMQTEEPSINSPELQLDSPPCERPITLFGRARLGIWDHNMLQQDPSFANVSTEKVALAKKNPPSCQIISLETINIIGSEHHLHDDDVKDLHEISRSGIVKIEKDDATYVGSSKGLNASLRKLYRSMNVPVPRPLPSLTELRSVSKRIRLCSCDQ